MPGTVHPCSRWLWFFPQPASLHFHCPSRLQGVLGPTVCAFTDKQSLHTEFAFTDRPRSSMVMLRKTLHCLV